MSNIEYCKWSENADHFWDTSCNKSFCLENGTPVENEMLFCCYCGDVLKQNPYKGNKDEK